jgi:hypothetical protein
VLSTRGNFYAWRGVRTAISARAICAPSLFDPEAVAQSLAVVPAPNVAFFAFAGVSLVFTTQLKHPFCNLLCINWEDKMP